MKNQLGYKSYNDYLVAFALNVYVQSMTEFQQISGLLNIRTVLYSKKLHCISITIGVIFTHILVVPFTISTTHIHTILLDIIGLMV